MCVTVCVSVCLCIDVCVSACALYGVHRPGTCPLLLPRHVLQALSGTNVASSTREREGYMRAWLGAFTSALEACGQDGLAALLTWYAPRPAHPSSFALISC